MDGDAWWQALVAIVGPAHVRPGGEHPEHERDWRGRWHGRARAIVAPGSVAEVAAVVRACAAAGVPIVPQGGNTGLVGGGVPDDTGTELLLSLRRLNRVRAVDPLNLALTAEAGCVLQAVQQAAADHDLLFPLSLAAEGTCTVGGNLATNAGGTQVLRYGNARELCLGVEVVTPQGEVWDGLGALRKDNTGYSLRDLFVGSEGTLGIITAATLRLYPAPRTVNTALVRVAALSDALALLQRARERLDAELTAFEAMNTLSMALVARHQAPLRPPWADAPWTLLVEQASPDPAEPAGERFTAWLAEAMDEGTVQDAVVAGSVAQRREMWALREAIPLAQAREGLNIKHDIALPISRLADFVATTDAALAAAVPGVRGVNFGHLGDGNLHYNVQAPEGTDAATFLARREAEVNAIVYDRVAAHGGSVSAEHGVGWLKRDELAARKPAAALAMMRAIKQALDPQGLMNPGRVL
jgi:FAD/FMN-containing dehydrogenase